MFTTIFTPVGNVDQYFGFNVYTIAVFLLLAGTFIFLASHSFTGWFKDTLKFDEGFGSYTFFGTMFMVAEIIIFTGYVTLVRALNEVLDGVHGRNTQALAFPELIINLGVVVLLVAFLLEAFAGFQMLRMINKKSQNKVSE